MRRLITLLTALLTVTLSFAAATPAAEAKLIVKTGAWQACASPSERYCYDAYAYSDDSPLTNPPSIDLTTLGLTPHVSATSSLFNTVDFSIDGFNNNDQITDTQLNATRYAIVLHTGGVVPRYTTATARDFQAHVVNLGSGYALVLDAHPVHTAWFAPSNPLNATCMAGTDCGDINSQADAEGTGWVLSGTTQDLASSSQSVQSALDGVWVASDSLAKPAAASFLPTTDPTWTLGPVGAPHLTTDAQVSYGRFEAFIPASHFDDPTGYVQGNPNFFISTSNGDSNSAFLPVNWTADDSGVTLSTDALPYSLHNISFGYDVSNVIDRTVTLPPDTPAQLYANVANHTLSLNWTASEGAQGYVARAWSTSTGAGQLLGACTTSAPAAACTIANISSSTPVYVAVSSFNASGESAATSRIEPSNIPVLVVPSAPRNVVTTTAAASVHVSWTAPASSGSSPITSYEVSATHGGTTAHCSAATPAGCTVTGLTNGTSYTVSVTATNLAGASLPSAAVTATPIDVPSAPTNIRVVAGNARATVSWAAPSTDGGSPIRSYTARAVAGQSAATCTATAPALTCILTGLTNAKTYAVTVTATSPAGTSAASTPVNVKPSAPVKPAAPKITKASGAKGSVSVTWTKPSLGTGKLKSYTATVWSAAKKGKILGRCTTAKLTCVVTKLKKGTVYVSVVATTTVAASPASTSVKAVVR